MKRKAFVKRMALLSSAAAVSHSGIAGSLLKDTSVPDSDKRVLPAVKPRAITMWDFSWIERRWPGAGYEDWDRVLRELTDRGYNAVRIDAFPHLVAENPHENYLT